MTCLRITVFLGGLQVSLSDFKSGDVFAEVQYLPNRIDYSFRFDRKVIFWETPQERSTDVELQKYSFQKIEFGLSYPISVRTRISLKPLCWLYSIHRSWNEYTARSGPEFRPSVQQFYSGGKAELVYDNSVSTGMNIIEGTRGKITATHNAALGNSQKSFSRVSMDVRHYQKVYREIVFAVRGFVGSSFGNSPKKYLLGGIDNWFSNRINYEGFRIHW